jgi:hypothetical protein
MYFLTLVTDSYRRVAGDDSVPRCIGFSPIPFKPSCLGEHDTECGYYTHAVVEKYSEGLWQIGEVLEWWRWNGEKWVVIDPPPEHYHVSNWAIA